jgi:hypothetical protein
MGEGLGRGALLFKKMQFNPQKQVQEAIMSRKIALWQCLHWPSDPPGQR